MHVAVIGTGYVGLVTGVCLAKLGHNVTMVDKDMDKIEHLHITGEPSFYEPGLAELMRENKDRLKYRMTNLDVVNCDAVIIAVGTPKGGDVKDEMTYVYQAAEELKPYLKPSTKIIIKSTVVPGTNDKIKEILPDNEIISNPEFLREGSAIKDTIQPERIVVGANSPLGFSFMESMYKRIEAPMVCMSPLSAEMVKHASNAFLAMKISFINEIANICEAVGADIYQVKNGMKYDSRIGNSFLEPGVGYGGSCFPKDVTALARVAKDVKVKPYMLEAIDEVNYYQKRSMFWTISHHFKEPINTLQIAVLGLAFKPNTDDTRMSPSMTLIRQLKKEKAVVTSHDPQAKINGVGQCDTVEEAIKDADVAVIMTEWDEYLGINWTKMKGGTLFDGRGMYRRVTDIGGINNYYCIGKGWTVWGD